MPWSHGTVTVAGVTSSCIISIFPVASLGTPLPSGRTPKLLQFDLFGPIFEGTDLLNDDSIQTTPPDLASAGSSGGRVHFTDNQHSFIVLGQWSAEPAVTVNNVAPTAATGADAAIDEGPAFSDSGSVTDPGADTWMATVDYGSGAQAQALNSEKSFGLNHTHADDFGFGTDEVTATVLNVAPTTSFVTAPATGVRNDEELPGVAPSKEFGPLSRDWKDIADGIHDEHPL